MSDIIVKCKDCPTIFTVTEGEQEFLAKHFDSMGKPLSTPKRCKPCRNKKRERYNEKAKVEASKHTDSILDQLAKGEKVTLN